MAWKLPQDWVTLYTDASGKGGSFTWAYRSKAAWCVHAAHGKCKPEITTVGQAELYAILMAMHQHLKAYPGKIKGFYIRTDSKEAIGVIHRHFSVQHCEVRKRLLNLFLKLRAEHRFKFDTKHVKAHRSMNADVKAYMNGYVDKLAKKAH